MEISTPATTLPVHMDTSTSPLSRADIPDAGPFERVNIDDDNVSTVPDSSLADTNLDHLSWQVQQLLLASRRLPPGKLKWEKQRTLWKAIALKAGRPKDEAYQSPRFPSSPPCLSSPQIESASPTTVSHEQTQLSSTIHSDALKSAIASAYEPTHLPSSHNTSSAATTTRPGTGASSQRAKYNRVFHPGFKRGVDKEDLERLAQPKRRWDLEALARELEEEESERRAVEEELNDKHGYYLTSEFWERLHLGKSGYPNGGDEDEEDEDEVAETVKEEEEQPKPRHVIPKGFYERLAAPKKDHSEEDADAGNSSKGKRSKKKQLSKLTEADLKRLAQPKHIAAGWVKDKFGQWQLKAKVTINEPEEGEEGEEEGGFPHARYQGRTRFSFITSQSMMDRDIDKETNVDVKKRTKSKFIRLAPPSLGVNLFNRRRSTNDMLGVPGSGGRVGGSRRPSVLPRKQLSSAARGGASLRNSTNTPQHPSLTELLCN